MSRSVPPSPDSRPHQERQGIVRASGMVLSGGDLAALGARWRLEDLRPIGGFENALFRSDGGRVLRVTHSSRRTSALLEAECAFMRHLRAGGVSVVEPIPDDSGDAVTRLRTEAGDDVFAICMTEAQGRRRPPAEWTTTDIEAYGALVGSMHAVAADHEVGTEGERRPGWTDPLFDVGLGSAEADWPELVARMRDITTAAAAHPAGAESLLIHQDAHLGNLFITDDGKITAFDFDDCAYGTAVHDVAIVLFYWALVTGGSEDRSLAEFVRAFLAGYESHAYLPAGWPDGADLFLSFREIEIYWLVATEPPETASAGEQRFMEGRRERILSGVPYLGRGLADLLD